MATLDRLPITSINRLSMPMRMKRMLGMNGLVATIDASPFTQLELVASAITHVEPDSSEANTLEMVLELDRYAEQVQLEIESRGQATRKDDVSQATFLKIAKAWDASRIVRIENAPTDNIDGLMEYAASRIGKLAARQTYTAAHNHAKQNGTTFDYELDAVNTANRIKEKELVTVN